MGGDDGGLRQLFPQPGGGQLDVIDAVVQVKDLPAAAQLLADRLGDERLVVFQHIGLHRVAVLRRFVDDRHIPDAAHRHVEGAGNGGGGKGQHIHAALELLELFLLLDAEPLLLIDDAQPQVLEPDVLLHQPVGAHHHVDLAVGQLLQDLLLLLGGAEAGQQLHIDGVALQPPQKGLVMLPGQDGGGDQHGALLAVQYALKDGPQRHLGLAEAHVAAQQPVHRLRGLHVMLDLGDAAQLVLGLLVLKALLEFGLPVAVRAEGKALGRAAPGVQLYQFGGHILHRFFHPLPGAVPFDAAQPVQLDVLLVPSADVPGHQVQLGYRDVQQVGAGVADLDVILGDALHLLLDDALKDADAVGDVDHRHAGGQVGQVAQRLALLPAATALLRIGAGRSAPGAGEDGPAQFGVFQPGGKPARQHKYFTGSNTFRIFYKFSVKAPPLQVFGQRQRAAFGAAQQPYRPVLLPVMLQVLAQRVQRPAPYRKGIGMDVQQRPQRQPGVAAGKAVQNHGGQRRQLFGQQAGLRVQKGAAGGQRPLLQQGGDILLLLPAGVVQRFPQVDPLRKEQQPVLPVAQQAAFAAQQGGVAVGGGQRRAALQQRDILRKRLPAQRPLLGGQRFPLLPQQGGQLLVLVQQLPHRGDLHPLHAVLAALGFGGKGGEGIDLIPPVFQPDGPGVLRRVKIHDAAPRGKLAHALHLLRPLVAGLHQKAQQLLRGIFLPRLQR